MDPSDISVVDGFEAVDQNGVDSNVDSVVTVIEENVMVSNGDFENFDDDLCMEELNGKIEGNSVGILKVRLII